MFPWLKFECVTSEKQEVINIAETLGIDKDTVIGKLLRVWTWADHSTNDGCTTFHNATSAIRHIDETARCEGFAIAMQHERWLIITEDGRVTIPNYGRHNGATAKKRMQTLRRMAKYRSKLK